MKEFTNHLIHESSPYLLQHAHNPVNWYAWGEAALQKAAQENKPILISIGYAACHWCHVMEKESFEDEATAQIMNENFVCIKIDREERPDLDHIYMDAVQAITGAGGWPLNVFLTPQKQPFFGGTYFPPQRIYNRASWKEVLLSIATAFKNKQEDIIEQAENLTQHLQQANTFNAENLSEQNYTAQDAEDVFNNIIHHADKVNGGFGGAPKFPNTFIIQYLLQYYYFTKDAAALQQACLSLDKMVSGGIYDQLGGGFARYATDNNWLVPHFEKMLYDNALLIIVLCEAWRLTKKPEYLDVINQTLDYVQREMTSAEGGFYSAQDADSEGEEGKYYVWDEVEVKKILEKDAALFCAYFDITANGNWEGENILHITMPLESLAATFNITKEEAQEFLQPAVQKLLAVRLQRVKPPLDDKIILGWNALMITAYCKAYAITANEDYRARAVNCATFLCKTAINNTTGEAHHTYKNGIAKYPAFLDDYAFAIQAWIQLQEITGEQQYLLQAKQFTEFVLHNFKDSDSEYFYFTPASQKDIILRKKEIYDGAVPSGNAVMAGNLWYLGIVFDSPIYRRQAKQMTDGLKQAMLRYPTSFGVWANHLLKYIYSNWEIVIVGNDYQQRLREIASQYIPNRILQGSKKDIEQFPLLRDKKSGEATLIYVCKEYACLPPIENISALQNLISGNSKKI